MCIRNTLSLSLSLSRLLIIEAIRPPPNENEFTSRAIHSVPLEILQLITTI